jgi:hypothetical protein
MPRSFLCHLSRTFEEFFCQFACLWHAILLATLFHGYSYSYFSFFKFYFQKVIDSIKFSFGTSSFEGKILLWIRIQWTRSVGFSVIQWSSLGYVLIRKKEIIWWFLMQYQMLNWVNLLSEDSGESLSLNNIPNSCFNRGGQPKSVSGLHLEKISKNIDWRWKCWIHLFPFPELNNSLK